MVLDVNGISLHWQTTGNGEPLLWLHGGMGCGDDWRFIFSDAPEGFEVIAPDLRGHGASTNPAGVFTFRQAALDVLELMRHLGADPLPTLPKPHTIAILPATITSVARLMPSTRLSRQP